MIRCLRILMYAISHYIYLTLNGLQCYFRKSAQVVLPSMPQLAQKMGVCTMHFGCGRLLEFMQYKPSNIGYRVLSCNMKLLILTKITIISQLFWYLCCLHISTKGKKFSKVCQNFFPFQPSSGALCLDMKNKPLF